MTTEEKITIAKYQASAPVDITALANSLGLSVYDDDDLSPGVSGMIARDASGESESGFVISVNSSDHYLRRRFTVAHEIAHFLLHRDKIGDGIFDDAMYRSDKMNSTEEFEANNMAADLLMPRFLVVNEVRKGVSDTTRLAHTFQVSEPAMRVRMRYLYHIFQ